MSKWTDIRDSVVDALNVDVVTEDMKNELTQNIVTNAIPAVEAVADKFTTQIQEQSKSETGWNMLRDRIVLPLVINGAIWAVKFVLNKSTATNSTAGLQ
ncbi:hypothetical protein LIQ46_07725 [Megasphaera elsdenii]|uniref:hypothetical protein n=1 Tax=Megasphaera elsdenii TaxID=907 RepID=UPI001D01D6C5|nr:hypothetical protein [Megasphaera elsdenii]UVY42083.1 MAG: hypothetical protein [Bacteriophage sp.]MCB5702776.1 hypothetical protein [Megasphaera elsdenii]MCB5727627.1 hypothetical protein [Megasphaera elsdenii]MCB5771407.1 hypothetical protein [Megasphaera elsdenii]MCI6301434.1 hypothetical protein [Megasphaera elsdenii]